MSSQRIERASARKKVRRERYDKSIGKIIPRYAIFSVIFCFVFNSMIYSGTQFMMRHAKHYDLTMWIDRKIPYEPDWIWIYLGCFAFWAINYILITGLGKEEWFRFAVGDYLSRIVCGLFFILLPTTNVRPTGTGTGLSSVLMSFMQGLDAPTNLFPSIHCLVSWFCFAAIRGNDKIPKWYRICSAIFAILVCASTQFTKQHYLIDVFGAIVISEGCLYFGRHTECYIRIQHIFEWLDHKVFGESEVITEHGSSKSE